MKKASSLLVPALLLGLSAAIVQSCASGETDPAYSGGGSGGDSGDGSGGDSGDGSGGRASSGGVTGTSSGGSPASSGGVTGSSSGGAKSGGTTGTSSGGKTGSGGTKSGGTTGTSSGGKTGSGGTTSSGSGGMIVSTSSGGITGGGSGNSTGTTCTKQDATMTVNNGMATNGTWSGYAYTYVGSTPATITPDCSTSSAACFKTAAKQLCVSGMIGADPTFGASAGFGWDIGGTGSSGAAGKSGTTTSGKPAIVPGGTGLAYNIPGLNSTMRLQIEDASGIDYCANVTTPNTGTIPWAMFTQKCYNSPPGTAYSPTTKIASVQVVVPATSGTMPNNFCFCVVSLGPAS